jgi:hypothetical protein
VDGSKEEYVDGGGGVGVDQEGVGEGVWGKFMVIDWRVEDDDKTESEEEASELPEGVDGSGDRDGDNGWGSLVDNVEVVWRAEEDEGGGNKGGTMGPPVG